MRHIKKAQVGKRLTKKSDYVISERGDTLRGKSAEAARKHQRDYTKWLEENIRPMEPRAAAAWDAAKKKREATAPKKKMRVGGKIKKAQTGFKAVADKTKVKKRVPASIPSGSPTYKYLYQTVRSFGGPNTAKDTAEYKKGYKQGLTGKAEKWTSAADYNRTRSVSGWQEGYETRQRMKKSKKQSGGGKVTKARSGKQMLKRADGSYSQRGLWDNIRANRGSGRKPTAAMLKQERKIKSKGK